VINYIQYINNNQIEFGVTNNYISKSKIGGRGVFAGKKYKIGEIVEISPAIIDNLAAFNRGILKDYIFGYKDSKYILGFGYASMYSHNDKPNLTYIIREDDDKNIFILFIAKKNIKKDEELFINYGDKWWNSRKDRINKK
jgi:SET domain-containing protein